MSTKCSSQLLNHYTVYLKLCINYSSIKKTYTQKRKTKWPSVVLTKETSNMAINFFQCRILSANIKIYSVGVRQEVFTQNLISNYFPFSKGNLTVQKISKVHHRNTIFEFSDTILFLKSLWLLSSQYPSTFSIKHSWYFPSSHQSFWENKLTTSVLASFLWSFQKLLFLPNCHSAAQRPKGLQMCLKIIVDIPEKPYPKNKMCLRKGALKCPPEVVALMLKRDFSPFLNLTLKCYPFQIWFMQLLDEGALLNNCQENKIGIKVSNSLRLFCR